MDFSPIIVPESESSLELWKSALLDHSQWSLMNTEPQSEPYERSHARDTVIVTHTPDEETLSYSCQAYKLWHFQLF